MEIVSALKLALADKVGQARFELWFGSNTCLQYDGDTLTVRVPNQFYQDWLRTNFREPIEAACRETLGKVVPVRFLIDCELRPEPVKPACTAPAVACALEPKDAARPAGVSEAGRADATGPARRRFCTLETFVVGQSNHLAWAAARSTASRLGQSSPLVIHGPTSVGKTHLLEGIYNDVRRLRSGAQAVYLSAEQFTTLFLEALHGGGLPVFRRKYRGLDLLIVDDIQFLAGKKATLTELLHMTDLFLRDGRQLVFAADRPPSRLAELGTELTTRLQSGLVCGVEMPEYETRLGIVRQLAERMGIELTDEVDQYVAGHVTTHARELSGALNRLEATSRALGEPIGRALAEQALAETVRRHARPVGLGDIDEAVSRVFGLDPKALKSEGKGKHVSHPRMLAMWLARRHTRAALSEIGSFFGGRSHSTVISAQKKVRDWMEQQSRLCLAEGNCTIDEAIRKVEQALRAG
jgi:chromosomal replication initiator protein